MTIGYDGSTFFGSQIQANVRTVQGELEAAVSNLVQSQVRLVFAGRTDRGVHACGQVVSGTFPWKDSPVQLRKTLNAVTPDDIAVYQVEQTHDDFHAQFDAQWREYRYLIYEADVCPVLDRDRVWWRRDHLNSDLAAEAAGFFVGRHAFGTFAGFGKSQSLAACELERTVFQSSWRSSSGSATGRRWVRTVHEFQIVAEGYLPQMVRNMVGALVRVGRGDYAPEWVKYLVAANDRRVLGEAAPPHGLILQAVGYRTYLDSVEHASAQMGRRFGEIDR